MRNSDWVAVWLGKEVYFDTRNYEKRRWADMVLPAPALINYMVKGNDVSVLKLESKCFVRGLGSGVREAAGRAAEGASRQLAS